MLFYSPLPYFSYLIYSITFLTIFFINTCNCYLVLAFADAILLPKIVSSPILNLLLGIHSDSGSLIMETLLLELATF